MKHVVACSAGIGIILCFSQQGYAQTTVPVTLQLPEFSVFSVDTTVVVPDSGRGYLGRVARGRYGRTSAGTPGLNKVLPVGGNRSAGSEESHSGMHLAATVLDLGELDSFTRQAAASIPSAAQDERDRAGLAIDFLRARHAGAVLARRDIQRRPSASAPSLTTSDGARRAQTSAVANPLPRVRSTVLAQSGRLRQPASRSRDRSGRRDGFATSGENARSALRRATRLGSSDVPLGRSAPPRRANRRVFPAPPDAQRPSGRESSL